MVYSVCLYHAWRFFPGYEGVITGIVISGYGSGGSLFIKLSELFVNPDDVLPNEGAEKPFDMEVAGNLPIMLRKIGSLIGVIFIIAILCTWESPKTIIEKSKVAEHVQSMISAQSKTSSETAPNHESILAERIKGLSETHLQ